MSYIISIPVFVLITSLCPRLHAANHVLIQLLGKDSRHRVRPVHGLSLSARRIMALVTKEEATSAREPGSNRESTLTTTSRWCGATVSHSPAQVAHCYGHNDGAQSDKMSENTKDPAERGSRISLTFRPISTLLIPHSPSLSGSAVQEQEYRDQQLICKARWSRQRGGCAKGCATARGIWRGEPRERV